MQSIRDVMTETVWTIDSTATIREAARMMATHDIGFLPVIHERVSAGVITDRDIVVRVVAADQDPDATYVGTVVSVDSPVRDDIPGERNAGIASLEDNTPIDDAIRYMDEKHVRRVTVHDKDYRIIGVVSRADLPEAATAVRS